MPNIVSILFFFTAWNYCLTEAGDGAMCRMKTKDNKCCVFPFVYRGKTYDSCVKGRANSLWCSLSPSYDDDKRYGYCRGMEGLISGDDQAWVYANGRYLGRDNGRWDVPMSFYFPENLQVVAIYVKNSGGPAGLIASFANGIVTDNKWKCTTQGIRNWQKTGFDDSNWPAATIHGGNSGQLRVNRVPSSAKWIGPSYRNANGFYCRSRMTYFGEKPSAGGSCDKPLGLQSGWVENKQIRASSIWSRTHAAWRGRLHMPKQYSYPGAWVARTSNVYQWIEVSFYRPVLITALATQGRANYNQWVKSYTLTYSEDGKKYSPYSVGGQQKVFIGNRDRNSVVKHNLSPQIEARFLRLHPKTWQGHISMRMELYGCLKVCKVDVGILMDESGSVSKDDFTKEKNFVMALAGHFQFGPSAAQFGVITYSTGSQLDIALNRYRDLASFQRGVSAIIYKGGWTHTGAALKMAYSQLFTSAKGARANVAKVLVIVTDGESTGGMVTLRDPIKKLKESRVNIISIGVGHRTNKNELNFMAASPTNTHVFSVNNMDQLRALIGSITSSSCSTYNCRYVTCDYYQWSSWSASCGVAMKRTRELSKVNEHFIKRQGGCSGLKVTCDKEDTETKTTNCPCVIVTCSWNSWGSWSSTCGKMTRQRTSKATQSIINRPNCNGLQSTCPKPDVQSLYVSCCKGELGILMDESGSIKDKDFEEEKQFIKDLANGFTNFGPNGMQMAVISYSTDAKLDIKLNQYSNKMQFINAVRKIKQFRGWTYTDKALIAAKNQLFQKANGARPGVSKILVVLTDGASTGGEKSLRVPLKNLEQSYVNIFAIGIGRNINKRELEMMATPPVKEHVFYVATMQQLQTLLTNIGESACMKYKCRYVTCDYSVWSSWSTSCGTGMRRKRTLTKQNEQIIEQQGGCSGLTTSCQTEEVETKNSLCPCKYVTCSWNPWGEWSQTCGQMTRQRTSKVTQHVVNRTNCDGLQTTCPARQTQSAFISCPCKYVTCSWNDWSSWSATCGESSRQRTSKATEHVINRPSCSGFQTSCPKPQLDERTTNCPCKSVRCTWKPWTDWSATCGFAERTRSIKTDQIVVQQPDCSGLPQICTQPPERETRSTMCTCQTVQCEWSDWSEWSATCGAAKRTRTMQSTQITVQKENCDGLPQSCPQPPETEQRTKDCACRTVNCEWEEWSSWSTSCGVGTRMRDILETVITVNKSSCAGLAQECTEQPQMESREVKCACPTVECNWNEWTEWSATCGAASRTRTIKTIKTTVQKLKCEGLPQTCPQPPETEQQTTNCKCKTVNCEWALWSSWSTTCGVGTRTRHIEETAVDVFKPDCSGLPQTCPQPPESDVRDVKCDCQTVNCKKGEWEAWSATCGRATRKRKITTEQIVVQQPSCDGLPQSCPSGPETETRKSMCTCQSVNCTWGEWGNWSNECGEVNRTRHIVKTQTSVQAESCDGISTNCTQQPETENNKLPECELCYTVECSYNPWSAWSATCGNAFRRRIQVIEEIELFRPSCDDLPLECPGDEIQDENRTTPLCPTTKPPPQPTT